MSVRTAQSFDKMHVSEQFALSQQLKTSTGFFLYYFDRLKYFKTKVACFNNANKLYEKIYGSKKFLNYRSFRRVLGFHRK